ncbi:thiol:disulfide interchange protein DsbA/DsbL [Stenotrophomonas sp. MMGLT7]|uniref:thiol:disulfide interchange protein DsbA/DsbL n=1 Tax=Stenotrophomonas sp. MMGLT7 TaxID=2901227 RepID=UPI001E579B99|nr:thiol:disulfide interchange protein DsbA/DsbL [Stenotrophomonas sp. MMGLT7]MCD7099949.1 thiol:disulfide interchange protein DsbA/DsbL [Stenotrophomonas sp. MMGLT7]
MKSLSRLLLPCLMLAFLVPLAASAAPAALVPGVDYDVIPEPKPYAPLQGKIEVAEVFGYVCVHCAHFEPMFEAWAAKQPQDVRVTPVPAAFGGPWNAFARAYFAASDLGVAKRSHRAMYEALHDKRSMPMQNVSPEELAGFYAAYGVQPARFVEVLRSPEVDRQMQVARDFASNSGLAGTPTIIVNGKYLVKGKSFEDILRITDALVAQERAAGER